MKNCSEFLAAVSEYVAVIDELYAFYLDAGSGFVKNEQQLRNAQKSVKINVAPEVGLDELPMIYGVGDPSNPTNRIQVQTTQGAYCRRNLRGGRNHIWAAQWLIVLLYEYWESKYRAKLAAALGLSSHTDLKVPLLGDLRLIRQDIIHHRGVVRSETVRKISVVSGLVAGSELVFKETDIELIVRGLKKALDKVVIDSVGIDPEHRKLWRVE